MREIILEYFASTANGDFHSSVILNPVKVPLKNFSLLISLVIFQFLESLKPVTKNSKIFERNYLELFASTTNGDFIHLLAPTQSKYPRGTLLLRYPL